MNTIKTILLTVLTSMLFFTSIQAGEAENKGLAISIESKSRDLGWKDTQAEMKMLLKNQHGETSVRQMRIKSMEQDNDGDKSLTIFDTPRDVQGTAFLSFSHPSANDEQWLYLPALKRVKRISSRNKTGSFMGSEFSFEDLTSFEVEKYDYKYLKDEAVNGFDCFVVEQYPRDKYSGYKRRIVWIDKVEYRSHKVEFYDRKNSLLKTLSFSDYNQYLKKYWRAGKLDMVNHQSGKSTSLSWDNYQFQKGLDEKDFNKNALKRAR
ncbi:MAG: outer membrane lipoprotein-sorting protein [Gammaproteobacteria bacterium]|nr:outer membrane lipoprotein-sorting protein [Gammaproteobacteria bacterium]